MADDHLTAVRFICGCGNQFEAEPERVDAAPERDWHPWAYFATCGICRGLAPQAYWEINLLKAHAHATGPRTPEGRARVAQNLGNADQRRDPERTRRTRFNSLKHGLAARTATYFPARPGRYARCRECEHLAHRTCEPVGACLKHVELMLPFHVAFESGDPRALSPVMADNQANLQARFHEMLLAVLEDGGPRQITPEWYYDKDGGFHLAKYADDQGTTHQIMKISEHPLMGRLLDLVAKNRISMHDLGMSLREHEDEPTLPGYLDDEPAQRPRALELQEQTMRSLVDLRDMISRGQAKTKRDPVLVEQQALDSG